MSPRGTKLSVLILSYAKEEGYGPVIVGSIIPVIIVAAPSERLVHGGMSMLFPSASLNAK